MNRNLLIFAFAVILILTGVSSSFSQSRAALDKQYAVYQKNKVKTETIKYSDGITTVSQYDNKGRPTEVKNYNNGAESNVTNYTYDEKGYLKEESYFGYESGDIVNTKFYFDEAGNLTKTVSSGSLEHITEYYNDEPGNPVTIRYSSKDIDIPSHEMLIYINSYENSQLVSVETVCKDNEDYTIFTKYTYNGENLTVNEEFDRDCSTGTIKFSSKKIYEYGENGLIANTIFTSAYIDGTKTGEYSYVKY